MTEQELIEGLEKVGYNSDELKELLFVYNKLRKNDPNFTIEECYARAVEAYETTKDWPKDGIIVD